MVASPVHPHVRGDGESPRINPSRRLGSPPVRGDGDSEGMYAHKPFGSPPRAWGRRWVPNHQDRVPRFTPTCVGTAAVGTYWRAVNAVHPHVRGDGGLIWTVSSRSIGSPPRAWGRRTSVKRAVPTYRFTPHVRGDGGILLFVAGVYDGSPPRAWGRRGLSVLLFRLSRFTPTCVGTAAATAFYSYLAAVHPHVRGFTPTCVGTALEISRPFSRIYTCSWGCCTS